MLIVNASEKKDSVNINQQQMTLGTQSRKSVTYDNSAMMVDASDSGLTNQGVTVEISQEAMDKLEKEAEQKEKKEASAAEIEALKQELERMKENSEATEEGFKDLSKIMEIARRISRGDKVPQTDERKLMEYSNDLYQACKAAAMLNRNRKRKEYDSLFEDEEDSTDKMVRALDRENAPDVENVEVAEPAETATAETSTEGSSVSE